MSGCSSDAPGPSNTIGEYSILLSHRLAVGKRGGPAPVIKDLDWNPKPRLCKGKRATAMIACVSSFGTNIYYFPQSSMKWTSMVIKQRPSRGGSSLQWHKDGISLVSSSDPKDGKNGKLSLLTYDSNFLRFNATTAYECAPESRISSLRWLSFDNTLVVALYPLSQLLFFDFEEDLLSSLGTRTCKSFPQNTPVALESHPSEEYFFSCAPAADTILVWGKPTSDDLEDTESNVGWVVIRTVKAELGLRAMVYNGQTDGLLAIE